ncbi:DUF433 domain-containing protein [Hyphobacterium indicum]|uniref:DUF433 domain-containing protein n=1 Tax=Hyphobacterium indicum TaxID=2162714 RepID=UPI000D656917|nr:DUF433 domain-containing protein [Hyphobacterium indicum]
MTDFDSSNVVFAFTEEQTAKLTGVSRNQLKSWDRSGFFTPSFADEDRRLSYSRTYSFRDLVCIQVIHELRNNARVSMQHLREVREKLDHLGDELWSKTTLYVLNRKVVFDNPETRRREEVVSCQGVLNVPLQVVRRNLQKKIELMWERDSNTIGMVAKKRNIAHNQTVIAGTRIPVSIVLEFLEAGYSAEQIIREYPVLTKRDVEAVAEFDRVA